MKTINNTLTIDGIPFELPVFFPSISSIKTNLPPLEYLKILVAIKYPFFLLSAYDFCNSKKEQSKMQRLLLRAKKQQQMVLLDSGNYEGYWNKDHSWSEARFKKVLKSAEFNIAFCYDEQNPSNSVKKVVDVIERRVVGEQKILDKESIIPVVHAAPNILHDVVVKVAKRLEPLIIAVPERLLGDGILARAETILKIRQRLNNLGFYCPIHLLGTGNPLSILIYTLSGADSFDGLEWCQTVVDYKSARLYHFQQRDFFSEQSIFDSMNNLSYTHKTLVHNLFFYKNWMAIVQKKKAKKGLYILLKRYIALNFLKKLKKKLPHIEKL